MASIGATSGPTRRTPADEADVELRLPADSAYASVLRTTTAGLAARLDFTDRRHRGPADRGRRGLRAWCCPRPSPAPT